MLRALVAVALLLLAVPAGSPAAQLETDRRCYVDAAGQLLGVTGSGWAPGSSYSVTGAGITETGTADSDGGFAFQVGVPSVAERLKPRTLTLTGRQDGEQVAQVDFKVVQFLVFQRDPSGKPTGRTTWGFSGFRPGKPIYVHVKRGGKTYTERAGRGDQVCGTLKKRLRRLPGVPESRVAFGQYKVFVDNRRKLRRGGLQFRASITIRRV